MEQNYTSLISKFTIAMVAVIALSSCSFAKEYEYKEVMAFYDDLSEKTDKATSIEDISALIEELNNNDKRLSTIYSYSFAERMAIDKKVSETMQKMKNKLNVIMFNSGYDVDTFNNGNMHYLVSY